MRSIYQMERYATPTSDIHMGIAYFHCQLGEPNKALDALEKAAAKHSSDMIFLNAEPAFHRLRGHPRFTALQRRVGLPVLTEPPAAS